MTPTRFRKCLAALHRTQRGLAAILGCSDSLTRRWAAGGDTVPPAVATWLEALTAAHPVPRSRRRPRFGRVEGASRPLPLHPPTSRRRGRHVRGLRHAPGVPRPTPEPTNASTEPIGMAWTGTAAPPRARPRRSGQTPSNTICVLTMSGAPWAAYSNASTERSNG